MRHRKEQRESLTEAKSEENSQEEVVNSVRYPGLSTLSPEISERSLKTGKSRFSGMVRTGSEGQWVEKGVGVKEDLIMTLKGSSRVAARKRHEVQGISKLVVKKEKKKQQNMKIYVGINRSPELFHIAKLRLYTH